MISMKNITCLGIECTAHTFGVGIIGSDGSVLTNERSTYKPKPGFGIIPSDAKKHFYEVREHVLEDALKKAGLKLEDIDILAVSQGPGLPLSLKAGMELAIGLAKRTEKPLYGANHCIGHIEIGILKSGASDPITVYVSGGNTQILGFASGRYRVFGETLDMAIGNAIDAFAREAGLDHPGGPKIEALAKSGKYIEMPYVVKGMDLSYTGIVSQAVRLLKQGAKLEDICFSLQETCFAMLTEVAERALAHTGKSELLLTGGVAANKRLQEMLEIMCQERGAKFYSVPMEYAGDNATMIAWVGMLMHKSGMKQLSPEKSDILEMQKTFPYVGKLGFPDIMPRWRTDDVDVMWK